MMPALDSYKYLLGSASCIAALFSVLWLKIEVIWSALRPIAFSVLTHSPDRPSIFLVVWLASEAESTALLFVARSVGERALRWMRCDGLSEQ